MATMGFREALDWLLANDDLEFYTDGYLANVVAGVEPLSVTGSFVSDCYRKTDTELARALQRRIAKRENENDLS